MSPLKYQEIDVALKEVNSCTCHQWALTRELPLFRDGDRKSKEENNKNRYFFKNAYVCIPC